MTSDEYVTMLVGKYAVNNAHGSPAHNAASALIPSLRQWAGDHLLDVTYSGSYAKGTATSLGTDVDLFISLNHDCGTSVKDIYYNLYLFLHGRQFQPERRNVAINVRFENMSVDLVPARKQQDSSDHSLYRSRHDTWMQTNVGEHIRQATAPLLANNARNGAPHGGMQGSATDGDPATWIKKTNVGHPPVHTSLIDRALLQQPLFMVHARSLPTLSLRFGMTSPQQMQYLKPRFPR